MCDQCKLEISQFRNRSTLSPWKLNRGLMADRLEEILADPDTIQQGALGLCGVAAFLRAWILNDHLAAARFALDLYERGKSQINGYEVNPCDDLLNCDYATITWVVDGNPAPPCPSAEWMIMSALQDEENFWVDFEGTPGKGEGQTYGEVAGWFEDTKLYANVDEQFPTVPVQLPYNTPGINHLLGLRPDDDTDVVLNINTKLFGTPDTGWFAFYSNAIPNHYIGLCTPATYLVESGVEKVKFTYFSWGEVKERKFTKDEFESSYYGALVADAKTLTRPLAPLPIIPPLPPHLTATVSGTTVKLAWQCKSLHVEEFVVERRSLRDYASFTVLALKPCSLGGKLENALPDPVASEYWYRVKAVSCAGESDYSYDVMVSLPSGAVREVHYWDDDIWLPPMHVKQFTVVRAPKGLTPLGYGRFAHSLRGCQAPQVVYDSWWEDVGGHTCRMNKVSDLTFKPNRDAYVFVRFGTGGWSSKDVLMEGGPVTVKLSANPAGSAPLKIALTLNPSPEGKYYWGAFTPQNQIQTSYTLSVEISAQDSFVRFGPRVPSGHVLDGDPSTEAYVDQSGPPYQFLNYQPGSHTTHAFSIGYIHSTLANDRLEINDDF